MGGGDKNNYVNHEGRDSFVQNPLLITKAIARSLEALDAVILTHLFQFFFFIANTLQRFDSSRF